MFKVKAANTNRMLLRGVIAIITGLVIIIVPDLSMEAVMRILGVLLIADGVVALLMVQFRSQQSRGLSLVPRGAVSVIIGGILVLFPAMLVSVFIFVIGFILLMAGLSHIINIIAGRGVVGFSWLLTIISVIAFLSGIVLMTKPFESAQTILIFFGVVITLYGAGEIYWSIKMRKFQKNNKSGDSGIIDAEYEEIDE
jgi:uncharacterized membrane protein HdeD (DUF308 family)